MGVLTLLTEGPRKPARLAAELEMFSAQMVGVVRHLHEMNLVRRTPHPSDKRAILVELTPPGGGAWPRRQRPATRLPARCSEC